AHAIADTADGADGRIEPHHRLHWLVNGVGNPIHSADWLEHGGLHVPNRFEQERHTNGRPSLFEFLERERRKRHGRRVIAAALDRISGASVRDVATLLVK